MLLDESSASNLLAESSRIYLNCELFLTELQVLAFFTHTVTLPLLNAVAISTTEELLKILPQLYADLSEGKTDTLKEYTVIYKHLPIRTD